MNEDRVSPIHLPSCSSSGASSSTRRDHPEVSYTGPKTRMTKSNSNPCSPSSRRAKQALKRVGTPLALLIGVSSLLSVSVSEAPTLAAGGMSGGRLDMDADGLLDLQELVLGTSPDQADTDLDGYSDLEELARQSDPVDILSVPGNSPVSVGMYAHTEGGIVNLSTALFVEGGDSSGLRFDMGVVINRVPIILATSTYKGPTKAYIYSSRVNPKDKLLVLETPVPQRLVSQFDALHVYATMEDMGSLNRPSTIDVMSMVDFSGETMRVEPSPNSVQGGGGIVFRPLSDGSNQPSSWVGGQMCWQNTAPVGTAGANILFEVEAASCEEFDSSCSPSDCAAKVGTTFELPDPAVLLGG